MVVNVAQGTFIRNKSMAHNILLSQELMLHYTRQYMSPRCAIKIDLHKAYDSVHWDFVVELLTVLNFPPHFVQWMQTCVTSPSYSVVVNRAFHGVFPGNVGE